MLEDMVMKRSEEVKNNVVEVRARDDVVEELESRKDKKEQ